MPAVAAEVGILLASHTVEAILVKVILLNAVLGHEIEIDGVRYVAVGFKPPE